jgi:aminoglycoside phosphotransferase family enzyme
MSEPSGGEAEVPPAEKVAFLASAAAHGRPAETKETRMAWVFLAGDRVYKLKKPIRTPRVDHRTRAARRRVCETELRLNRRLAPDVYLGLSRLTREADGRLALDGEGEAVDWLVRMRRLPETLFLETAIREGRADEADADRLAERLAAFYAGLPAEAIDPAERVASILGEIEQGLRVLRARDFGEVRPRGERLLGALHEALRREPALLGARIEAGRIVEGHGDLRPEHVCLERPPVVIDCLEFSRDLRLLDPFEELAFLGMECAALGAGWIGPRLVDRCAARLEDRPCARTLAFYTGYRAALRARQSLEHLLERDPREPEKWAPKAGRYLDEAERALRALSPPADRRASRSRGDAG